MTFPLDVTRFAVAGDWHGDMSYAVAATNYAAKQGAQVVIHTGDFGYQFKSNYLNAINNELLQQNMYLLFVDGNHEDFDWLYDRPIDEDGTRHLRNRLFHLPRGFRWSWEGVSFLAAGGAHSVDRPMRNPGSSWWAQEEITMQEFERIVVPGHADVVIAHDAPTEANIPGLSFKEGLKSFDHKELLLSHKHRMVMQAIIDNVTPKFYYHGHYHRYYVDKTPDRVYVGLNCNGNPLVENIVLVETGDLK